MNRSLLKCVPALFVFFGGCGGCNQTSNQVTKNNSGTIANVIKDSKNGEFKQMVHDLEDKDRVIWQKPEVVIQLLGDISNKTVADLGAGTGYFAFKLLPKARKIIALDIDTRFIGFMDSIKSELQPDVRNRFEARLVETDNPKLAKGEVDAVVVVNTYMYIENRVAYLRTLRQGISHGGKVLIIDYKDKNLPVGPPSSSKVSLATVEKELKEAGFDKIVSDDTRLEYQYIVTAINMN
jgi:SAM-dependent methyltransferase